MAKGMLNIDTDFSEVAEFIGSFEGAASVVETQYYIDDILRAAHGVAAKQFDRDTAAIAVATQNLNHMYEWGTAGINPAPNTPRLSPTSERAKLWRHKLEGGNTANKRITFEFKPSIVPVPLPTPRTTGIRSANVGGWPKRRHTFMARPWISEYGVTVKIKPKYSEALFIPLRGNPMTSDPRAIKNNYIMTTHTVRVTPGEQLAGNFTTHWYGWWNSEGREIIMGTSGKLYESDLSKVVKTGRGRKYRHGPAKKAFSIQVSTARAEAQAEMKALAKSHEQAMQIRENTGYMHGKEPE